MKIGKLVIIGVLILALGWVSYYWVKRNEALSTEEIKTATVKKGDLKIAFAIDGKTVIDRRDLKFTINGKVTKIAVKEGQEVKKGQLLMALDTRDVQKNLDKAMKDYLVNRNSFDQTTQVTYADKIMTDTIKRVMENTQYSLDKSVIDVEIKNIALRESYLYAPIAGVVSAINIKEGEVTNTQSGGVVLTITKPETIFFESMAEDIDVLKINQDQKVTVKIDSISDAIFPASTDFISNLATVDQNGLSTYKVRVIISDANGYRLLDGMSGQIIFTTKEKNNVLILPNGAIFRKDNKAFVEKYSQGVRSEVEVETGFTDGKAVEIISGLGQGDVVILP